MSGLVKCSERTIKRHTLQGEKEEGFGFPRASDVGVQEEISRDPDENKPREVNGNIIKPKVVTRSRSFPFVSEITSWAQFHICNCMCYLDGYQYPVCLMVEYGQELVPEEVDRFPKKRKNGKRGKCRCWFQGLYRVSVVLEG
ncbi:hypothetical protein NDU88_008801 [Pleurodeles waltl]|uniref:Uncharacterized protein n=1 Tax=Pleurodeles waltl TaxID=8319 RepID=A0AAV7N636_PLEWA|nr:hypothetical protein NDU88_008801 [Pleurodeles waltl]